MKPNTANFNWYICTYFTFTFNEFYMTITFQHLQHFQSHAILIEMKCMRYKDLWCCFVFVCTMHTTLQANRHICNFNLLLRMICVILFYSFHIYLFSFISIVRFSIWLNRAFRLMIDNIFFLSNGMRLDRLNGLHRIKFISFNDIFEIYKGIYCGNRTTNDKKNWNWTKSIEIDCSCASWTTLLLEIHVNPHWNSMFKPIFMDKEQQNSLSQMNGKHLFITIWYVSIQCQSSWEMHRHHFTFFHVTYSNFIIEKLCTAWLCALWMNSKDENGKMSTNVGVCLEMIALFRF